MCSSSECQVVHWKESHKNECCTPKQNKSESEVNKSENMCNGKQLKTSNSADSTVVLNPISLGFFKIHNKKIKKEEERLANHFVNAPTNAPALVKSFPRPKTVIFYILYIYSLELKHNIIGDVIPMFTKPLIICMYKN